MTTPSSVWDDWVWPVAMVNDHAPVISDGFGRTKRSGKGHFGVDIMHRRKPGDEENELKASDGGSSKGYVIFQGEGAYSAGPGKIYELEKTATGHTVKVSHRVHGRPILSVYRHLQSINPLLKKDMLIGPGTHLGPIGDNPIGEKDPPHLHFELWDTSLAKEYPAWNIDPARVMGTWKMIKLPEGGHHPYEGEKLPTPSDDAFTDATGRGGSHARGGLVGILAAVGLGTLGLGLLKRRRGGYV